jgi:hypothetical protein
LKLLDWSGSSLKVLPIPLRVEYNRRTI